LIHGAHAVCFCTLVTILDLLLLIFNNLKFSKLTLACSSRPFN
jgi:hypothetical protein